MTRLALASLLLPLLAVAAVARAKRAPLVVKLEISKERCRLLEEVRVEVDVQSRMSKTLDLRPIRLATDSVTLRLVEGEETFRLARVYGQMTRTASGVEIGLDHQPAVAVRRGKKITGSFGMHAIRPGKYSVIAEYRGAEGLPVVESGPVTLTVDDPPDGKHMVALIQTGKGTMTAELDPDRAFNTVHEFVSNAKSGFYGTPMVFFRVIDGFMAQVGDKTNTGRHHAGHFIPAEFNDRKHERGVLSMARAGHPDSGGSQFFVMHGTSKGLDGKYTAFGKVVDGLEALDEICTAETEANPNNPAEKSKPKDPVSLDQIVVTVK